MQVNANIQQTEKCVICHWTMPRKHKLMGRGDESQIDLTPTRIVSLILKIQSHQTTLPEGSVTGKKYLKNYETIFFSLGFQNLGYQIGSCCYFIS